MWTWAFVGVTCVQAAIVLAFESLVVSLSDRRICNFDNILTVMQFRYVFGLFQTGLRDDGGESTNPTQEYGPRDYEQTIPTFLTLYIFGCVYELLLVWDALRLRNTIQIIGLCIYNVGLLIYAAVQMGEIDEAVHVLTNIDATVWPAVKPFLIAIPCVIAVGTIGMSFVARKLYDEFAWTIYKHISADLRMKRRFLTYQVCLYLLVSQYWPRDTEEQLDLYCAS